MTGSSPEPLIAEAAAMAMNYCIENGPPYMDVWNLLSQFIDEGLMAQGSVGELIWRTFSILAMDRAILAVPANKRCVVQYQTPVTVTDYYRALLTDEAWEKLCRSIPINFRELSEESATLTFEDAFGKAYFHFSHYSKASDDTPFKDKYAWALWPRGTGVVGQLNQYLSDIGNPMYFPAKGKIGPQSMSMSLHQLKTGVSEDPLLVNAQSAERLKLFSSGHKPPYIDAVHCFALMKDQVVKVTTPSNHPITYKTHDTEAPRYRIDIRGLNAYRGMTPELGHTIRAMIDSTKNALFKHHPRQDALPLLRQMQPLLNDHPDTTAWFGGFGKGKEKK